MNEIKQTEENLRKQAEEKAEKEKQQEIEALKQQQEQEAVAKAIKEKEVQDNSEKTDTYICIKVNGLTKEATNDLLEVIKKHNLKYIKEMK